VKLQCMSAAFHAMYRLPIDRCGKAGTQPVLNRLGLSHDRITVVPPVAYWYMM
jgi:hypothetical protein